MIRRLIQSLFILLLIVGCGGNSKEINNKEPNGDSNIMVRVINNRSDPTKIIIGSTNYGIIVSRDTSEYTSVELGNNDIYLNDEYFRQFEFMINESNPNPITRGILYYTFTFREYGYAYRMDTRVRN